MNRNLPLAAAAAALLLAAAACTSPPPASESGSPSPEPSPSTPVEPARGPLPAIDLECDDLLTADAVSAAYGSALEVTDRAMSEMAAIPAMPEAYSLRASGALVCSWTNGVPYSSTIGSGQGQVGLQITVLPDAADLWPKYADYYGCGEATECGLERLIGDRWVSVFTQNGDSYEPPAGLLDPVYETIAAAVDRADSEATIEHSPLPEGCLLTDQQVTERTGSSVPVPVQQGGGGGWSLEAGAAEDRGEMRCNWFVEGADLLVGGLRTIEGGAWAWDEARVFPSVSQEIEPVDVVGLRDGDSAWLRCPPSPYPGTCYLDLIVAGNWIELTRYDEPTASISPTDSLPALGADAVAAVYAGS